MDLSQYFVSVLLLEQVWDASEKVLTQTQEVVNIYNKKDNV